MRHFVGLLGLIACLFVCDLAAAAPPKAATNTCNGIEQVTVYVPYRRFRKLLKTDGMFISKKQYRALMKLVQQDRKRRQKAPPVDALITHAHYAGKASERAASLSATLQLRVLKRDGWAMVPLRFHGLPILSATLDGAPALLFQQPWRKRTTVLLVKGAGVHKLALRFAGPLQHRPGLSRLQMRIPSTPYTSLAIDLKGTSLKAKLNGNLAPSTQAPDNITRIVAQLGPQKEIDLSWSPQEKQKTPKKSLISARIINQHTLQQGVLRTAVHVQYKILQAKTAKLSLRLPKGYKLIAVRGGTNLKPWRLQEAKGQRVLQLAFFRKFLGTYKLSLELERLLPNPQQTITLPAVHAREAEWEQGFVALHVKGPFNIKPMKQAGLNQIDPREYATRTQQALPTMSFSYLKPGYELGVALEKIKPRIRAQLLHQLSLTEKQLQLRTRATVHIERAGIFQMRFLIPKGWEFRDVLGRNISDKYFEPSKKDPKRKTRTLVVVFKQKVGGPSQTSQMKPHQLLYAFYRILGEPFLSGISPAQRKTLRARVLRPNSSRFMTRLLGQQARRQTAPVTLTLTLRRQSALKQAISLPLVRVLDAKAQDEKGVVGLMLPDHINIETSKMRGLFEVDELQTLHGFSSPNLKLRQAFRYNNRPASGAFQLSAKKTSLEAQLWLPFHVRADGYSLKARIRYNIRFAGTNKLHFSAPNAWVPKLQLQTDVRETKKKKGKARTLYTVILHDKLPRGRHFDLEIELRERFAKPLQIGKHMQLPLDVLTVPNIQKQELFLGLHKEESLSLQEKPQKLERIDVTELPSFAEKAQLARAYRAVDPEGASLRVTLQKHRYQSVLNALIPHMHLDAVASVEGRLQVIAYLRVQSQGRQFLKIQLPQGSQVLALQVAGKHRFRFELDRDGELLVDLANLANGRTFHIIVHYQHPLSQPGAFKRLYGRFSLQGPRVVAAPIMRTTMKLYLPEDFSYVAFDTDMTRKSRTQGFWFMLRERLWNLPRNLGFQGVYSLRQAGRDLARKLPQRGKTFQFFKLEGNAKIAVQHRRDWLQGFGELILFLIFAVFLFWWAHRQDDPNRPRIIAVALLLTAIAGASLPEAWLAFCNAAFLSSTMVAGLWSISALYGAIRPIPTTPIPEASSDGSGGSSDPSPTHEDDTPPAEASDESASTEASDDSDRTEASDSSTSSEASGGSDSSETSGDSDSTEASDSSEASGSSASAQQDETSTDGGEKKA